MEKLRGIAVNVVHEKQQNFADENVAYVSKFQINEQQINQTLESSLFINEGDEVVLYGRFDKNRLFHSMAYKNLTTGREGGINWITYLALGLVGLCATAFFVMDSWKLTNKFPTFVWIGAASLFLFSCIIFYVSYIRNRAMKTFFQEQYKTYENLDEIIRSQR